jgi:hypothetical protein
VILSLCAEKCNRNGEVVVVLEVHHMTVFIFQKIPAALKPARISFIGGTCSENTTPSSVIHHPAPNSWFED